MPFTYQIDADAGMLWVFGDGAITQPERIAALQAWMSDEAVRPGLDTLCDFSGAASVPTLDELRHIVSFVEERAEAIGRKKLALVTSRPFAAAVARQFQMLAASTSLTVAVFGTRRDALDWIRQPAS